MARSYSIKETFRTVQGEGFHAGTPAIFIRFAGCNMWSGYEGDRMRDAARNHAQCPLWCDTDFVHGEKMTAVELGKYVEAQNPVPLIVLTGGEPMLQVDDDLLDVLHDAAPEARIAIETNGTARPLFHYDPMLPGNGWLWITLSPKRARAATVLPRASELKLVYPAYEPVDWLDFPAHHYFLQPCADQQIRQLEVERQAAEYVTGQYRWRLSLQTHKILGVR